jgi:peptidyl-prolyl cis-trans isomerase B (cyclophilin B)
MLPRNTTSSTHHAAITLAAFAAMMGIGVVGLACDDQETDYDAAYSQAQSANEARATQTGLASQEGLQAPGGQDGQKKWDRPPEMQIDKEKTYFATIKTNLGEIRLELFDDAAPITVNNFVFLAKNDFYDGTIFHRVIDDFMIQGGDPTGTGRGDAGYKFQDETRGNPHKHEPFTLSMANAGPNTNGSQFFITERATPHLDGRHTVFGRVVEGQETVQKITDVATGPQDRPREDVTIEDVVIEEAEGDPTTRPSTRPAGE